MKAERKTLDDIMRTSLQSFLSAAFVAVAFTALGPTARATAVQTTYRIMNNGPADFGSGNHSGGGPVSNAAITYDWSTTSGRVLAENGRADFGASDPPGHHFGRPDKGGRIIFGRPANGAVLSLVDGVLYYDAFGGDSCARMEVDWLSSRRPTPEVLEHFPALNCGPGGDANLAANQFFIFRNPAFSSLEKIRLSVQDTARPTEAVLLHYGFAGQVGDFEVEPAEAVAAAGEPINYALTWTVPGPLNWHDIHSLELRLALV